jgi:hypothetical protein
LPITKLELDVLSAAPTEGEYVLPLGAGAGRWTYSVGNRSVTRQVNRLLKNGMMLTDAAPAGTAGDHPSSFRATVITTDAGRSALAST